MNDFIHKHRKGLFIFSSVMFLFFIILLLIDKYTSVNVTRYVSSDVLMILAYIFVFSSLFFFILRDEKHYKRELEPYFKYAFLILLLIITIGNLNFKFLTSLSWFNVISSLIKQYMLSLTLFAIGTGFFTFYFNRERVEKELEDEKENEERAEEKRASEFDHKFKFLKWFDFSYNVKSSWKEGKYILSILNALKSPFVWLARLPYTLVKWMYKEGWWYVIILISIIILGFVLRLWLANTQDYDLDEGVWMYDSFKSLNKVPVAEFISRSPPVHMFFAFVSKTLFDNNFSILIGRGVIATISSICIFLIYILLKKFEFKKGSALISSFLFAISPFVLFWNGYIIKSETFNIFFILIYLILLFSGEIKNKKSYLFVAGIVIGIDYFIRNSTVIVLFCTGLFLIYKSITTKKYLENIKKIFAIGTGFILPILLFGYFLVSKSNFQWIFAFLNPISTAFSDKNQQVYAIDYLQLKLSILSNVWILNFVMFTLAIVFLTWIIYKKNYKITSIILITAITFFLTYTQKFHNGFHLINVTDYFFLIPFFIGVLIFINIKPTHSNKIRDLLFIISIILIYSFFYFRTDKIFVSYFSEFIFLLIIPFCLVIDNLNTKKERIIIMGYIFIISIFLSTAYFGDNITYERTLQQNDVHLIETQLTQMNISSNVLTNQPIFILNRDIPIHNANDWNREFGTMIDDGTNFNYEFIPFTKYTTNEVMSYIKINKPIIIYEIRTKRLFDSDTSINEYITQNYSTKFSFRNKKTLQEYKILEHRTT